MINTAGVAAATPAVFDGVAAPTASIACAFGNRLEQTDDRRYNSRPPGRL
jgi:hypothetical protein